MANSVRSPWLCWSDLSGKPDANTRHDVGGLNGRLRGGTPVRVIEQRIGRRSVAGRLATDDRAQRSSRVSVRCKWHNTTVNRLPRAWKRMPVCERYSGRRAVDVVGGARRSRKLTGESAGKSDAAGAAVDITVRILVSRRQMPVQRSAYGTVRIFVLVVRPLGTTITHPAEITMRTTYKALQAHVRASHGRVMQSCWIAHRKVVNGLPVNSRRTGAR